MKNVLAGAGLTMLIAVATIGILAVVLLVLL
jgi:hypothetical protein